MFGVETQSQPPDSSRQGFCSYSLRGLLPKRLSRLLGQSTRQHQQISRRCVDQLCLNRALLPDFVISKAKSSSIIRQEALCCAFLVAASMSTHIQKIGSQPGLCIVRGWVETAMPASVRSCRSTKPTVQAVWLFCTQTGLLVRRWAVGLVRSTASCASCAQVPAATLWSDAAEQEARAAAKSLQP
jgi:hypothetical protein